MNLKVEVWKKAVADMEHSIMGRVPRLFESKKAAETIEQYAERAIQELRNSLDQLKEARKHLEEAEKENRNE